MKTKSKIHTDIKSLILAKASQYARQPLEKDESSEDEGTSKAHLRKATEADKEKKREKMRLKKQLKKQAREKSVKKDISEAQKQAIDYLHLWHSSRETWHFKKNLQIWLLKNILSLDNITKEDFEILVKYIIDLKGAARSRLSEECEKVIKSYEDKSQESLSDDDLAVFERARNVLQILV